MIQAYHPPITLHLVTLSPDPGTVGALIIRTGFWGYAGEGLSKSIIKEDVICILSNSSERATNKSTTCCRWNRFFFLGGGLF